MRPFFLAALMCGCLAQIFGCAPASSPSTAPSAIDQQRPDAAAQTALDKTARQEDGLREQDALQADILVLEAREARLKGKLDVAHLKYAQALHLNSFNVAAREGLDQLIAWEERDRPPVRSRLAVEADLVSSNEASLAQYRFETSIAEARQAIVDRQWDVAQAAIQRAELAPGACSDRFTREALRHFASELAAIHVAFDQARSAEGGAAQRIVDRWPQTTIADERTRTVKNLKRTVQELTRQMRYREAIDVVEQILILDPADDYALGVRPVLQDRQQFQADRDSQKHRWAAALDAAEMAMAIRKGALVGDDGRPLLDVRLKSVEMNVVVHGELAQASVILTFANDQWSVLGGNLSFALPEGASVVGYGLEVDGKMVDGVAVEKERARVIYESEIHKRVDPGLVEQVEGNVFRTRLYPIPPHGTRAVKIEYVTPIVQSKEGRTLALPMRFGEALESLSIKLRVSGATASPIVKAGNIPGLNFEKEANGFAANASVKNPRPAEELVLALPGMADRSIAVEKRLKFPRTIEELEGNAHAKVPPVFEHYFLATDVIAPPARPAAKLTHHHIGVVWDASLSREGDHAHELKLLEAALGRVGNPEVDLIVLRNDLEVRPHFPAGVEGTAKLIAAIREIQYDGATALGALSFPKNGADLDKSVAHSADYDFFLLFTDGFGNLGAGRPARAQVPVYALCDEGRANHPLLQSICQESGGEYFNLKQIPDEQVLAGIGNSPLRIISIECDPAEIAEVYPPIGSGVAGRMVVTGKLLAPQATLKLNYGFGHDVIGSLKFTLSTAGAAEGSLLPRYFAQRKAAALALFPEKNAAELEQLGKQFNLVTPRTSLLVLETVEQYVQYRVVPPPTQPEIYKVFLAKIEEKRGEEIQSRQRKIQQVAAMWDRRVKWWETKYEYPADWKVVPERNLAPSEPLPERIGVRDPPATQPRLAQFGVDNARAVSDQTVLRRREEDSKIAEIRIPTSQLARGASDPRDGYDDILRYPNDWPNYGGSEQDRNGAKQGVGNVTLAIKPWDPSTPYIEAMKSLSAEKAYDSYLAQRKNYAKSPAFYFDCADYLVKSGQTALGIRVLTDVLELDLHDARLIRIVAHRLNQIGQRDMAIDLFETVLKLRPEEPQSYRDLALALADRADEIAKVNPPALPTQHAVDRAIGDDMRALELLNKVVMGDWPRFAEIELPVLMEANEIAARAQRLPGVHDFHNPLDSRLQKNLDLDLRVVLTWDADQTDIDLWVTEPSGEKCFYQHNRTTIGGLLSRDFTDGYGPEEYCLRKLMPGKYRIQANYFGSRQQELTGPATVQATLITHFGRPDERRQSLTVRLQDRKQVIDLGEVELK